MERGIKAGEFGYVKLFFEYRFGRPKQIAEETNNKDGLIDWHIIYVDREDLQTGERVRTQIDPKA
jgi:hypothetical protein